MDSFKSIKLLDAISKINDLKDSSKESYFKIISAMLKRSGSSVTQNDLSSVVDDLEIRLTNKELVRSTARLYKSAILYAIADYASRKLDANESLDEYTILYERVKSLRTTDLPKKSDRTSSRKSKHFSSELVDQLITLATSNKRFKRLREAITFIQANNEIGLRPIEWLNLTFFNYLDAEYIKNISGLKTASTLSINVDNAKNTYGRGFGDTRQLILAGIDSDTLSWITSFTNLMERATANKSGRERIDAAHDYLKSLQTSIYSAFETLGIAPELRPTIYSTRHQCISNAKKKGLTDVQIAALFGHASTDTAKIHYGKKMHGTSGFKIVPSESSVNAVELVRTMKQQHVVLKPEQKAVFTAQILLNKS